MWNLTFRAKRCNAWALTAAALISSSSVFAVVPASPQISGRVVDAQERPVAGALVIASLGGTALGWRDGGRGKLHCTAILADGDGRFVIPAWTRSGDRSKSALTMMQYGATLTAYHAQHIPDYPGGRVFHAIHRIPVTGTFLKSSGEVTIQMRRFERGDARAWRSKLLEPAFSYQCEWDADVANSEVFWDAIHGEVEEYVRATGDDNADGPLSMLKRVTKRPVTEYYSIEKGQLFSQLAAPVPGAASAASTSTVRIARVSPDPSKALRVGDRVSLRVDVEYSAATDSEEVVLIVQAGNALISNTRERLRRGSEAVTLTSEFVVPSAERVDLYTRLAHRGGLDRPESRTYRVVRPD